MKEVTIQTTPNFEREAKRLIKKYKSLKEELYHLNTILLENPNIGTPIGQTLTKLELELRVKEKVNEVV